MNRQGPMNKIIPLTIIATIAIWVQPAMAYIDPGSGSAIMSAIIGFFVATGLAVKAYWYKIKSLFSKKNKNQTEKESEG